MFCMPELNTHQLFPAPQSMLTDCYCFAQLCCRGSRPPGLPPAALPPSLQADGEGGEEPAGQEQGGGAAAGRPCQALPPALPHSGNTVQYLQITAAPEFGCPCTLLCVQFEADVLMFPRSCGSCCAWLPGAGLTCPQCGVAVWCGEGCRQADTTHSLSCTGLATNR